MFLSTSSCFSGLWPIALSSFSTVFWSRVDLRTGFGFSVATSAIHRWGQDEITKRCECEHGHMVVEIKRVNVDGVEGRWRLWIKGSRPRHVINCHFRGFLDREPELVVRSFRLSFLRYQRGVLFHPCPPFSSICFHDLPRLLDLVLDAGDLKRDLLFGLFQKIQSIDDVLGWHFVTRVTSRFSCTVASVV